MSIEFPTDDEALNWDNYESADFLRHLYRTKQNDQREPGTASRYWCDSKENNAPLGEAAYTGQISAVSCSACLDELARAIEERQAELRFMQAGNR